MAGIFLLVISLASSLDSPLSQFHRAQFLKSSTSEMFSHAISSYLSHSFPSDMHRPVSCGAQSLSSDYHDLLLGNFSLTLIDSLDSLVLFNKTEEFARLGQYVIEHVRFDSDVDVSVFETVIRVVGGLLSSHVAQMELGLIPNYQGGFVTLAKDLAQRLLPAFQTPTGLPISRINLRFGLRNPTDSISTAEAATISLEFALLSHFTSDPIYRQTAEKAIRAIAKCTEAGRLPGSSINVFTGQWTSERSTVGPGLDSYYEYLVKSYVAFGCESCFAVFAEVRGMQAYAVVREHMVFDGWMLDVDIGKMTLDSPLVSSLASFWPGLEVMLGDLQFAVEVHSLFYAVWAHYSAIPDVLNLFEGGLAHYGREYPLRPELMESNYYLYQATHHPIFLSIAGQILADINSTARTPCGFSGLSDVSKSHHNHIDSMETFFLSETLKYLYLTFAEAEEFYYRELVAGQAFWCADMCCRSDFSPLIMDLRKFVLSTEGHFVPILGTGFDLGATRQASTNHTCPNTSQKVLSDLIESKLRLTVDSHGTFDRTQPLTVPQRPKVLPEGPPAVETPATLMRLLLLNRTLIASELVASAGLGKGFPQTLTAQLVLAAPEEACGGVHTGGASMRGKVRPSAVLLRQAWRVSVR